MSTSFINYKGKKILLVDYSKSGSTEGMIKILHDVRDIYLNSNEMFLTINDFTGSFGSKEYMDEAKKIGKEVFDAKTLKTTILGITGIKKILLHAYNLVVKNKLVPFDTKEEALEYLVK